MLRRNFLKMVGAVVSIPLLPFAKPESYEHKFKRLRNEICLVLHGNIKLYKGLIEETNIFLKDMSDLDFYLFTCHIKMSHFLARRDLAKMAFNLYYPEETPCCDMIRKWDNGEYKHKKYGKIIKGEEKHRLWDLPAVHIKETDTPSLKCY